jgi:hypothetical protein
MEQKVVSPLKELTIDTLWVPSDVPLNTRFLIKSEGYSGTGIPGVNQIAGFNCISIRIGTAHLQKQT